MLWLIHLLPDSIMAKKCLGGQRGIAINRLEAEGEGGGGGGLE